MAESDSEKPELELTQPATTVTRTAAHRATAMPSRTTNPLMPAAPSTASQAQATLAPGKVRSEPWHLVTNQLNLMYLLAMGLVTGPKGFGRKCWSKRQQQGALALARGMGWQEVLKTRISLGKGDYRLQVAGNGVQLRLDGEVKAVTVDVDQARLFELLARAAIPSRLEAEVRGLLTNR